MIITSRVNGLLRRRQTEPSHSKSSHSVFNCGEGCFEVVDDEDDDDGDGDVDGDGDGDGESPLVLNKADDNDDGKY